MARINHEIVHKLTAQDFASEKIKAMEKELLNTSRSLQRLHDQAEKANREAKSLGGRFSTLSRKGKQATNSVKGFGLGILDVVTKLEGLVTEVDRLEASLTAITGSESNAQRSLAGLAELAKTTSLSTAEITDAFIKLDNVGLNSSDKALRAYANTASALGADMDDYLEAVVEATSGALDELEKFGVRYDDSGDKLKLTFDGVTTDIENNAQEIEGYLIRLGNVRFADQMEEQSKTFSAAFVNLTDATKRAIDKLDDRLGASDFLGRLFNSAADGLDRISGFTPPPTVENQLKRAQELEARLLAVNQEISQIPKNIFGQPLEPLSGLRTEARELREELEGVNTTIGHLRKQEAIEGLNLDRENSIKRANYELTEMDKELNKQIKSLEKLGFLEQARNDILNLDTDLIGQQAKDAALAKIARIEALQAEKESARALKQAKEDAQREQDALVDRFQSLAYDQTAPFEKAIADFKKNADTITQYSQLKFADEKKVIEAREALYARTGERIAEALSGTFQVTEDTTTDELRKRFQANKNIIDQALDEGNISAETKLKARNELLEKYTADYAEIVKNGNSKLLEVIQEQTDDLDFGFSGFQEQFKKLEEEMKKAYEKGLLDREEYLNKLDALEAEHAERSVDVAKRRTLTSKEFEELTARQKTRYLLNQADILSQGLDKNSRTIFEINKAAQTSGAIMDAFSSYTTALDTYSSLGPLAFPLAGLHLASGLAHANAIARTKYGQKSSSSPGASGASATPSGQNQSQSADYSGITNLGKGQPSKDITIVMQGAVLDPAGVRNVITSSLKDALELDEVTVDDQINVVSNQSLGLVG